MQERSEQIISVYLRLELIDDYLSDYEKRMLKRYGESSTGESIVRDILVPSDITLHALHYAIQKLFGWQNSHLRRFVLPEEVYQQLTGGTVRGWSDLVGELFQPPSEGERDLFWDDDYRSGSFSVWLRKRYTGPYAYRGRLEHRDAARRDVTEMLDRFETIPVQESFADFWARKQNDPDAEPKVLREAPLIDLTLKEMNESLIIESGTESLLEKLTVADLLASQEEETGHKDLPVTRELFYQYDFGDDWLVRVTKHQDFEDLFSDYSVGAEEVETAKETVAAKHKPVCLHRDGMSVMDDVGGLSGFARFLGTLYEGEDKEEAADLKRWAKSMRWNQKKTVPKKIL